MFLGMVLVELLASILLSERPLYRFKDLLASVNLGISQQIVGPFPPVFSSHTVWMSEPHLLS